MRNRGGKGGGTFGGGGGRNIEDEWDVSTILQHYDYSKPRPCVGLCFIMKLRGGPKPVYPKHPPEEREACVGMCHRDKEEGVTRGGGGRSGRPRGSPVWGCATGIS